MEENKKNRSTVLAALVATVALLAASFGLQPASAQGPGVNSGKSDNKPPISNAAPQPKIAVYKVARGQVQKDLILTGELKAARSTSIIAPDIRSSFANMVTFLAPEGSHSGSSPATPPA